MRIVVSGGGTAGHISPVLAVVGELQKLDKEIEILYIGSKDGLENKIIPQTGLKYVGISAGKFRRYHTATWLNIIDPTTLYKNTVDFFRFIRGYFEAKEIISEFDPDVVFAKGGYVSLPVGLAAHSLGYPLVIHESDSIMGLSNKILAKRADKVGISYPPRSYPDIDKEKLIYTGNPVRSDIYDGSKERAMETFSLHSSLPILFVIGGSQGSLVINQIVSESLPKLLAKYQIIHVSGERDYDWLGFQAGKLDAALAANYHLYNFLSGDLKDALAVADLVISRAGNNVIAELAALSKAAILIPLASSANGHQVSNAKILSRMGAAMLVLQDSLTARILERKIDYLFENPEERAGLANKLSKLSSPEAAGAVADIIIDLGTTFAAETKQEEESPEEPSKETE
jgi:UDP-N-acetylglucosamine--N-acetylmuramyl-(pentapeptide) pyrophosphoryl-undecaprenol N-acetylglucosamine transferase